MNLSARERRFIFFGLPAAVAMGVFYWYSNSSSPSVASTKSVDPMETVDRATKRLAALERQAATLPGKEAVLKQASAELAEREKGLLAGDTAEQAQAQLLQVIKRVAQQQTPPLDVGQVELGRPRTFGPSYGQVSVSITVICRIEQVVDFLAGLSAQPELTATDEISFGSSHPMQKTMPVRLTVSGLVPRRLVPQQKGFSDL